MRIAISGTHCCGKSTLIDEFLVAHPGFTHEPEPYVVLQDDYGELFAAEPSADDFYKQLEFNAGRLHRYHSGARVIFERSPADFLAYLLALNDLRRDEDAARLTDMALPAVRHALQFLDLIVFLPLNDVGVDAISDSEDPELRDAVDSRLVEIFNDDALDLFKADRPVILEAGGSTSRRLRLLDRTLVKLAGGP
jgi:AAA domain